jgi:hypothetical protein
MCVAPVPARSFAPAVSGNRRRRRTSLPRASPTGTPLRSAGFRCRTGRSPSRPRRTRCSMNCCCWNRPQALPGRPGCRCCRSISFIEIEPKYSNMPIPSFPSCLSLEETKARDCKWLSSTFVLKVMEGSFYFDVITANDNLSTLSHLKFEYLLQTKGNLKPYSHNFDIHSNQQKSGVVYSLFLWRMLGFLRRYCIELLRIPHTLRYFFSRRA